MKSHFFRLVVLLVAALSSATWALSGTKGAPLGGMGTGYVKFDATTGEFAASSRIPPAGGDMMCEFPVKMSSSSGFHFFAGGQSVTKAKTAVEDAKLPLYTADFGKTNSVNFSLNAFSPFIPGNGDLNIKLATSPCAFFEITAKNEGGSAIEIAVALEFTNKSSGVSGLLGGSDDGEIDPESGNRAVSFATAKFADVPTNPDNTGNAYMMAGCSKEDATFSAGGIGDFATTGILSNSTGNCVAAKCAVGAGESVRFKFVMSWWRTFVSGTDRYGVGKNDADNLYYHNFYQTSKDAAVFGMQNFDAVKTGVVSMVNRVMASNFPEWYKDRLLNNLYPLINNSFWAKDGRAAFWEGGYGIIGTIDQAEHAALWYIYNWPENQWMELAFWLSSGQWQDPQIMGQIHHDFNISPGVTFSPPESRFMVPWGQWDREDYWFQPNTTDWSDLNSMLIFKAYELMLATGNLDSLKKHFPKITLAADRLYKMSQDADASIPIQSKSTYDSHGVLTPQYSCGVAVTAYKAMVEMAKFVGDETTAAKYQEIYNTARQEYKEKFFNADYCTINLEGWAEGHVGGYSWADYFCFEPIMDRDFIEAGCQRLWNLYSTASKIDRMGGWHFYTYDHWGGALTAIGKPDTALLIHTWDHELYYKDYPDLVFWQTLFNKDIGPQVYSSYMTAPGVWRSYFQFTGYLLDNANQRLWIRPSIPSEMNKKITNAPLLNPNGWGTLYYDETGNAAEKLTQKVSVYFDSPVAIKELVLKNNTNGTTPFLVMDSSVAQIPSCTVTTEDWDIRKNIRVTFASPVTIGPAGFHVQVYSEPVGTISPYSKTVKSPLAIMSSGIRAGRKIQYSLDKAGDVSIDLLNLNGVKLGTIMKQKISSPGTHSFVWDGTTIKGHKVGTRAVLVLRLNSPTGTVSKLIYNNLR
ncbi:hypothetical protein JW935_29165 [candidate division KSB1 bacterium]|nr:hypothetical protein [candidate division KSB1 bacterium]